MPYDSGNVIDITMPAAADLSDYQYRILAIDANGRATIAVDPQAVSIIGVLQNKPSAADAAARIRVLGESKMVFGAAADEGAYITANPQGFGTATTTDHDQTVGRVLHAPGGSGNIQDILVYLVRYG